MAAASRRGPGATAMLASVETAGSFQHGGPYGGGAMPCRSVGELGGGWRHL
jgi:hypothetical protein